MNVELINVLLLFALSLGVSIAYAVRLFLKGKARYERVERQGGSPFLSKAVMEMGYWFFQPIGRFLAYCRVSANQVSWCSFLFGLLAGLSLAFGHFGFGALFAAISAVCDSLDGIVARISGQSSGAGEVLDASIDRYVEFFFLCGLVIYYREVPSIMILALGALSGSYMVSYSSAKAEALGVEPPKGSMRRPERALYLTLGAALSPITIPWIETLGEFPVPIGYPMVLALGLVAIVSHFSAAERLMIIARQVKGRESKFSYEPEVVVFNPPVRESKANSAQR